MFHLDCWFQPLFISLMLGIIVRTATDNCQLAFSTRPLECMIVTCFEWWALKIHGLRKWQTLKSVAFAVKHVACWMILLGSPSSGNPQQLWVETGDLLARTLGDCNDNSLLGLQSDLDFNYCTLISLGQLCIPFILSIWSHVVWGSSQPQLVRHSFTEPVMRATG